MKKLRTRRGTTLTEMLVAVAVLGLMTLAVSTGTMASLRVYRQSTALSESELLSSTLAQAVLDELRFARDVAPAQLGGTGGYYTSPSYGPGASLDVNAEGRLVVTSNTHSYELVGSGAYSAFTVDRPCVSFEDGCFLVDITIRQDGDAVRRESFCVRPLNSPPLMPAKRPVRHP